jgi:DNA-binding response OmpR family regulator
MSMPSLKEKPADIFKDPSELVPGPTMNRPPIRILLVEDDSLVLQLYSNVLSRSGYQVDTAEDGDAAWKAIRLAELILDGYDLLITDNSMPKVTGVELIAKIRSENMSLPVILATGMAPDNTEHLGLSAILSKPFSTAEFLQTVRKVLQGAAVCHA